MTLAAALALTLLPAGSVSAAPATGEHPGWYFDSVSKRWFNKGNWAEDENGWWYDLGDGTWLKNGRYAIDGDCDGVTEDYYFNENGYMMTDYTSSDGNYYNSDGHCFTYGFVITHRIMVIDPNAEHNSDNGGYNEYGCSNAALDLMRSTREENKKYIEVGELDQSISMTVAYANGFSVSYPYQGSGTYKSVSVSYTRSDLDGTYLFKHYDGSLTAEQMSQKLLGMGWTWGTSGRYAFHNGGSCHMKVADDGRSLTYGGGNHGNSIHLR